MMVPRLSPLVALIPLVLAVAPGGTPAQHHPEHGDLGTVRFDVSCAPAVRDDFDRAVALLHHMMYVESRRAFEEIGRRDPACAMAPWGVATTLFQPLWPARPGPEQLRRGWEEVRRARELGPGTDRERALVSATEAFFRDPESADWWTRIRRWAAAMKEAYGAHPDDREVRAFYALSRLAVAPVSEDRMARQAEAAGILRAIHEEEPTHPGGIHYTIHANDVDGRAGESLEVVRSYGEIAPNVPHALHMPTHIFVRLGRWPEVIQWNRKSAEAALDLPADQGVSLHYVHAVDYLVYAHLQRGEDEAVRSLLKEVAGKGRFQEDFASAFHLAAMPARFAVERRAWEEAAALEPRSPGYLAWDRYLWAEALTWLARGLGAVHTGDREGAAEAERRLAELGDRAEAEGERDFARYIEVDRRIVAARRAWRAGDGERALELARSAAELEGTVQKHPVSPGSLYPSYEALGDLLMDLGRPADAVEAYQASLARWPGRFNSILGAARAARESGDEARARAYYAELLEVVGDARSGREGVAEAKAFVPEGAPDR